MLRAAEKGGAARPRGQALPADAETVGVGRNGGVQGEESLYEVSISVGSHVGDEVRHRGLHRRPCHRPLPARGYCRWQHACDGLYRLGEVPAVG